MQRWVYNKSRVLLLAEVGLIVVTAFALLIHLAIAFTFSVVIGLLVAMLWSFFIPRDIYLEEAGYSQSRQLISESYLPLCWIGAWCIIILLTQNKTYDTGDSLPKIETTLVAMERHLANID